MMPEKLFKDKSLLIVSFSYAPMLNPRAFRWTALAEEFVHRGISVKVVCSWQPGFPRNQTLNEVEIHRVGNLYIESFRSLLAHLRSYSHRMGTAPKLNSSRVSLGKMAGSFWRQVAWPDTTCVWYADARRKVEALLRKKPNSVLVSVSPTFTAALVGYAVSRKLDRVRWVLDMGDPFSFADDSPVNNFHLYSALNKRTERAVFRAASAVIMTNSNTQRLYEKLYPQYSVKLFVVPPLLNEDSNRILKINKISNGLNRTCRIVFIGTLYSKLRKPDFLLELFTRVYKVLHLQQMELHIYGNAEECNDSFAPYVSQIGRAIKLHGIVPRITALNAIRESTLIVNIGNNNDYQLPSKLVEYVAAEKPILNIYSCNGDASKLFLKNYSATLNVRNSGLPPSDEQVRRVSEFIIRAPTDFVRPLNKHWFEQFLTSKIVKNYAGILFGKEVDSG